MAHACFQFSGIAVGFQARCSGIIVTSGRFYMVTRGQDEEGFWAERLADALNSF
jgi:hypothetical protein